MRQTVVVWNGMPEGDVAAAARFAGPREVEVSVPRYGGTVCRYRSGFDLLTLEPDRSHDDWRRTGEC